MTSSALLAFYRGTGTDHAGRRLEDMLAWGAEELENVHDYIQWLFPLAEPSAYNPWAPTLSAEDIAALRAEPGLRARLREAMQVMLAFYGLSCQGGGNTPSIAPAKEFSERGRHWLTAHNHNHLRLTRILKSLALLGLASDARMLLDCLERIAATANGTVSPLTLDYWRRAVGANPPFLAA